MYRDDRNAMVQQLDSLSREADSLRRDNQAMRQAIIAQRLQGMPMGQNLYLLPVEQLAQGERAALSQHGVTSFPVWLTGLLSIPTFGLFPFIHLSLNHDKLPQAAHNDPSAGKAIGFQFIPYFNLYWVFFNSMRLADRLNLQLRLRGQDASWLKGVMIACSVCTVIPYIGWFVLAPIMWTIGSCLMQSVVNRVAALGPIPDGQPVDPYAQPPAGLIAP